MQVSQSSNGFVRIVKIMYLLFFLILCGQTVSKPSKDFHRVLPMSIDPAFNLTVTDKRKIIIIVSKFRSGSTFMGELFNQNPDILYDFESFHTKGQQRNKFNGLIYGGASRHTPDELNMMLLQQTFYNCSIPVSVFLNVLNKHWRCGSSPEENMQLFGDDECDDRASSWNGPSIAELRRYHCLNRKAVALKVIRLRRIEDLELIQGIREKDIRVLHLIRDPRAMFRSRSGFKDIFQTMRNPLHWVNDETWQKLGLEAHAECESYIRDIKYGESASWLKGRYMKVKHDELSTEPVKTAEEIYRFVGLSMSDEVLHYISTIENEVAEAAGYIEDTKPGGPLNTHRNSKEVLEKWLKWQKEKIKLIDKVCGRLITMMGWPFLLDASTSYSELHPIRYNGKS